MAWGMMSRYGVYGEFGWMTQALSSNLIDRLQRQFCFASLTYSQIVSIAELTSLRTCDAGQPIFEQGETATHFFIVESGQVQVYKLSSEGKEVILHLFGPGEVFAEVPVFNNIPVYPASALCRKPTQLLAIEGPAFRTLLTAQPKIALAMLSVFAIRLHQFSHTIEDLALRSVDARLARYLLCLSEASHGDVSFQIHKKTVAAILGTIPETLSRSLKKLVQENLIEMQGAEITLKSIEMLQQRALQ